MRTSSLVLPGLLVAALAMVVPTGADGSASFAGVAASAAETAPGAAAAPAVAAASPATDRSSRLTSSELRADGGTTMEVALRQETAEVGTIEREYVLTVPTVGTGPRPLLVALHGRAQTVDSLRAVTGLEALGAQEGFVTVAPTGYGGVWNAGTCCVATRLPSLDDVAFLDDVVADVSARTLVDPSRVHLVGFSNGAMMAYRYACQRSSAVAGVAAVSGSMAASEDYADQGEQRCRPDRPVSVLAVHGERDATVPYAGGAVARSRGGSVAPVRAGIDQAAVAAGCTSGATSKVGTTSRLEYGGCVGGTSVRLIKVGGLGHAWTRDSRTYGYDTTVGIWSFLKDRRAAPAG